MSHESVVVITQLELIAYLAIKGVSFFIQKSNNVDTEVIEAK